MVCGSDKDSEGVALSLLPDLPSPFPFPHLFTFFRLLHKEAIYLGLRSLVSELELLAVYNNNNRYVEME